MNPSSDPGISAGLPAEALYRACDPQQFTFRNTADLEDISLIFGQARAGAAMQLAIDLDREGYNLFVMGNTGSGKRTLVMQFLAERQAPSPPAAADWVYVNNFADHHKPLALKLPPGDGSRLRADMDQLVEELRTAIPAMFESDEYRARLGQIEAEFGERHEKAFSELNAEAAGQNIGFLRTPGGFSFAPLHEGEVITPEDYAKLDPAEQRRIEALIEGLQKKLEGIIRKVVEWRRELRNRLKQLNREMSLFAVAPLITELQQRYAAHERIVTYLEAVQQDVVENTDEFHGTQTAPAEPAAKFAEAATMQRYRVNLIVDHSGLTRAPIVLEEHPSYNNLIGRVEHRAQFGALFTDYTLIKGGALHRANGGYLLLDAQKLLTQPFAWDAIKRALATREIRIESLGDTYGLVSTVSLAPESIPLNTKVVLFGNRRLHALLSAYDPDFSRLFKIAADFEDDLPRNDNNVQLFARLLGTIARRQQLLALDRTAVARSIEHSARVAGDSRRLATNIQELSNLLCEADHFARKSGAASMQAAHLELAIAAQRARADRAHSRMHEAILNGTLLIDTVGAKVGQVNGLAAFETVGITFAEPIRITATTRAGEGRVIDVQREVELSGAIHSKGVLILSSFLAARFAQNHPQALSASLVFEQTYGQVEGDSASLAELCALLSALAEIPLRQSLALTGSVNQLGEVQAIGAVNEKIEGFFELCEARGLTGSQGVIIPAANTPHLMLAARVVDAVRDGKFAIHAVHTVDEAIELLTGAEAGIPDALGGYPPASVNGRVSLRLRKLSRQQAKARSTAAHGAPGQKKRP